MTDRREQELARRAKGGDEAALGVLWITHRRWVAVVLLAHKPAEAELEDLLQEVALSMVRKIDELEDDAKFRGWLRMVALNEARAAGRKASLRRRWMRPLKDEHDQISDMHGPGSAARLDARLAAEQALQAARQLAPEYREPLLLRSLEGLSQRQIAAILELPETTVESRLARARRQLRAQLAEPELAASAGLSPPREESR